MFKPWSVAKFTITAPDPFVVVNAPDKVDVALIEWM
jgi:hypothetical protein